MKFIREIPLDKISNKEINDLQQYGFTPIWKINSLEIWYQSEVTI